MPGTQANLPLSQANEEWIQHLIDCGEFSCRSEAIDELIRYSREREIEVIRHRLAEAEESVKQHGCCEETMEEMLENFKEEARREEEVQDLRKSKG